MLISVFFLVPWLSLGLQPFAGECGSPQLLRAVTSYWQHLSQGDKDQALEWVERQSWKNFLGQPHPPPREWTLESVEPLEEGGCQVSVATPRDLPSGSFQRTERQQWVRTDGGWRVRVPDRSGRLRQSYQSDGLPRPESGRLQVLPGLLKIHFLSAASQGTLLILNGLDDDQRLERVKVDQQRFHVVDQPQTVPAGQSARLVLRYVGQEWSKEKRSSLTLHFASGKTLAVDILYNHLSPGTRALLGLTPEEAENLRRGQEVSPAVKAPSQPPEPPGGSAAD